jgi:hypothetical protein
MQRVSQDRADAVSGCDAFVGANQSGTGRHGEHRQRLIGAQYLNRRSAQHGEDVLVGRDGAQVVTRYHGGIADVADDQGFDRAPRSAAVTPSNPRTPVGCPPTAAAYRSSAQQLTVQRVGQPLMEPVQRPAPYSDKPVEERGIHRQPDEIDGLSVRDTGSEGLQFAKPPDDLARIVQTASL